MPSLHSPTRAASGRFGDPRPKGQALLWIKTASLGSEGWVAAVPFSIVSPASLGPQPEVPGLFWI